MFNSKEFDEYINEYDNLTSSSDKNNSFPFAGYQKVLDNIFNIIMKTNNATVLDLGFGTGKLTNRLYESGCNIFGQDFSNKMVELAKNKMPNAQVYQEDFSKGLVKPLTNNKYDYIVATYSFHHLTNEQKISFIPSLLELLNEGGKLIFGDIMFENIEKMKQCKLDVGDDWDDEESYFVIDEFKKVYPTLTYEQISFCSGLILLSK